MKVFRQLRLAWLAGHGRFEIGILSVDIVQLNGIRMM